MLAGINGGEEYILDTFLFISVTLWDSGRGGVGGKREKRGCKLRDRDRDIEIDGER